MDPVIASLGTRLAEVGLKTTAARVGDVRARARANQDKDQEIQQLSDLINELIDDKNELFNIAKEFEEQFVAQRLEDDDLKFIVDTLFPAVESLMDDEDQRSQLEQLKKLFTPEMLRVVQTVGFNFRVGLGEPFTNLLATRIARMGEPAGSPPDLQVAYLNNQTELMKLCQSKAAFDRYQALAGEPTED